MERMLIATIKPDSDKYDRMNLYYNGSDKPMTAEFPDGTGEEELGYTPVNLEDASDAVYCMYGIDPLNIWDLQWAEDLSQAEREEK